MDVRQNYVSEMDHDPVRFARWVVDWLSRYERAGRSQAEVADAVGQIAVERQIQDDVMAQVMLLVTLDTLADECFLAQGAPPVPDSGFGPRHE